MGQATHEQVDLMLKLYDMRRESRLRQARAWYFENFNPKNAEEFAKSYPPTSEGNTNMRMVLTYWDMVAAIANRGLLDEDLFFETTGEQWAVWERVKPIVQEWRALFKNPHMLAPLEEDCKRLEAWREKRAPGSTAAMREFMQRMAETRAQATTAG